MASITKLGKGKQPARAIDFVDPTDDRKRKRIRLGIVQHRDAVEAKHRIEKLLTARVLNQSIDSETAMWLSGVSDEIHERIVRAGLCEPREPKQTSPGLADWITRYLEQRAPEIAVGSLQRIRQTGNRLEDHFGSARPLDSIFAADAKAWRADMLIEGLAEATARLHCRNAKSIFNEAVEQELIEKSPMAKLKSGSVAANRDRFVSEEETRQLLETAPSLDWRVLIGLARLAGLRIPSESHILTWDKVDWERRRLTVFAPKTGQTRVVPIVPELYALLSEAWDRAPDGATKLLTLSRNNLHRNFAIIIERAGLTVWPDMWQTLRRSAETMFAMQYPQHVVSGWIGHSVQVSLKHYVQTPDSVFEAAAALPVLRAAVTRRIDGNRSQLAETEERWKSSSAHKKSQQPFEATGFMKVGGAGIEPATPGFSIVVSGSSETGASVDSVNGSTMRTGEPEIRAQRIAQHETNAEGVGFPDVRKLSESDPALRLLVKVWGELPDSVKNRILRLADEAVQPLLRVIASDAR